MVRGLPDEAYAALKLEARARRVSAEALARTVLERYLLPQGRLKLGTALVRVGQSVGGLECPMLRDGRRPVAVPPPLPPPLLPSDV